MSKNQESLYQALLDLKEAILKNFDEDVFILTPKALKDISRKKPSKIEDFKAISGLSNDFTLKYAEDFLRVIENHEKELNHEVKVSKSAHKVLNHYKDRLYNISKSNPNIYMNKTYKNRYYDLSETQIFSFLINDKQKTFKLPSLKNDLDAITTLYREVNKNFKETGSYQLYIAFPFVVGHYPLQKFLIKAPLIFMPMKLERRNKVFYLHKDDEKDMILNRDLLLATSKLEHHDLSDEMLQVKSLSMESIQKEIIPFYEKNGLHITSSFTADFSLFSNHESEEELMKFENFKLCEHILLGRFNPYSSMIQRDVDMILKNHKYNELLDDLITEKNLYNQEQQTLFIKQEDLLDKDDIAYINDLNDAQENVIKKVETEKKLVIWGPPGTGKSQTITSLVASSILRGENVLVVSEKKVALDVIYERLKEANKYALFLDDALDKKKFYDRISKFIDPIPPSRTLNNEVFEIQSEINRLTDQFNDALHVLYQAKSGDIKHAELFEKYLKNKDVKQDFTPLEVYNLLNHQLNHLDFPKLQSLENTFHDDKTLEFYYLLDQMIHKHPILKKLNFNLTRSGIIILNHMKDSLVDYVDQIKRTVFFKKGKIKKAFIQNIAQKAQVLTTDIADQIKYVKSIMIDPDLHHYVISNHKNLAKMLETYLKMDRNDIAFLRLFGTYDFSLRKYILEAYYTGYLENLKTTHQASFDLLDEYQTSMNKLNSLMAEKVLMTKENFEFELYKHAFNFSNTRRIMDIKRTLEQTRRPSPKSFFDLFYTEIMENVKIFMMTPEVVSSIIPLKFGIFDLIIFDEASQMYVEKGIPSIYRAKRVVIAGDPKQLRPSSLGIGRFEQSDDLYEDDSILKDVSYDAKSLLDLARYKYKETLLNYHYRSVYEELIAFSNHAFYDAKLIVSPNQKQSIKPPIEYVYVENAKFINRKNIEEAKKVIELLKTILKTRKHNESIGIITFNIAQANLIENLIDEECFKKTPYQTLFEKELNRVDEGEDKSLFVKNIENVQGDERDIIIFSQTYAKDDSNTLKRNFGWLSHEGGQNRLNVAITRARLKIYYVSSLYPDEFKVDDLKYSGPKLLKEFMKYCYYISHSQYDAAKQLLMNLSNDSPNAVRLNKNRLQDDVVKRLSKTYEHIHTNIGIGSYKVDIGIYDEASKTYLLGIILDIDDSKIINARKDLVHLEKYLKSRNWKVYRIFSSNWYMDANKEIRNIKELRG